MGVTPQQKDGISYIIPETADDLVKMLSSEDNQINLFRGQPYCFNPDDALNYRLLPSAWRKSNSDIIQSKFKEKFKSEIQDVELSEHTLQSLAEMYILEQFCIHSNEMGLYIPHVRPFILEGKKLREFIKTLDASTYGYLPSIRRFNQTHPLENPLKLSLDIFISLSIAQHHKLPTRLLDWTLNPIAALFFSLNNISNDKSAFNNESNIKPAFLKLNYTKCESKNVNLDLINVVPLWTNDYLHRQSGVFTYCLPTKTHERPSLESVIQKAATDNDCFLEIYILEEEIIQMIKKLYNESRMKLNFMPGYSSCVEHIYKFK